MTLSSGLPAATAMTALALAVAFIAAASLHGAVRHALKCKPTRCGCPLAARWVTGKALNGHVYTDATFWHGHNRVVSTPTGHAPPFQKLAGWKRRALRCGPLLLPAALLASWVLTTGTLVLTAACWAVLRYTGHGSRAAERLHLRAAWQRVRHPLTVFSRAQDMAMALAAVAGASATVVQRGLELERDYASAGPGEHVVTWYPPRGFKGTGGEKSAVEAILASRIGFQMAASWDMSAARPVLTMARTRDLPRLVYLSPAGVPDGPRAEQQRAAAADLLARVDALPEHKTAIGVDDCGNLVCWDWAIENPHGLLNAGSRHGKTEAMMAMVAQVLRKGGRVTYVDVKRTSIMGMKGTPGLTLIDNPRDMPAMWLAIAEWGRELDWRIDEHTKDPTLEWGRDLLVIEEVNQFSEMCDEFWENWPEEDEDWHGTILWKPKRAKRTPPIWRVVKHGVWEGAFAKKNVLIAGQNIEYRTVAGVRNSIGMRMMGAYQPQNWAQLVGTKPTPPAPMVKGRWCMINGRDQTWFQGGIAHLDANESAAIWRDYARAGRRMDGTVPVTGRVTTPFTVTSNGLITAGQPVDAGSRAKAVTTCDPRGEPVSLAEAVDRGFAPGATVQALRMDRHRSDRGELPPGLRFPEPLAEVGNGQAERFWSAEITAFNAQRRGTYQAR